VIDDPLTIADELAKRDPGRPKQASLRRAAATAYYAMFAALAKMCADELVGVTQPWDIYTPMYRALDHGAARKLFERVRPGDAFDSEALRIGLIFIRLRDARLLADYAPEPFPYSRRMVQAMIAEARGAIDALSALPPQTKRRLAVRLVTKTR
jgi:hypothetical protein